MKLAVLAAVVGVSLTALTASHGAAYLIGRAHEQNANALKDANATIGAGEANNETAVAVSEAADRLGRENARLERELNNALRELAAFEDVEPAAGTVGARAMVDPRLSRAFLCRVRRLREHGAAASARDCAEDRADGEPAIKPVSARAPS